jgi:hypothetical protein
MKRLIALASAAVLTLLGLVVVTGPASAKVPGPNGQIAFTRRVAESGDNMTFVANPDGTHMHQLLPGLHSESRTGRPMAPRLPCFPTAAFPAARSRLSS